MLRVVTDHHRQCDRAEGVYPCSSEPNEWHVGLYESLSLNPYLLEHRVAKDISRASIINLDWVRIVVRYLDTNNECFVMWVVEVSSVFF